MLHERQSFVSRKILRSSKVTSQVESPDTMSAALVVMAIFLHAMSVSAFDYPSSVNDTTLHENPFFLQIWSTVNTSSAYRTIGIVPKEDGTWGAAIGPSSFITGFRLTNGTLQLASAEGLHAITDGFHAAFGPEKTDGDFISKQWFFSNDTTVGNNGWDLISVSRDGLYGILSSDGGPSMFNGFKVCTEDAQNDYFIKYEGSRDGAVSEGCEAIALRTFLGPPYRFEQDEAARPKIADRQY
ncbi:hypothetical protein EJ05DRAFT_243986 [Pseudovirgaria hyperparasitica]|uniref:Uncharacterized protein n=1 Tax=Pseudovirgaria hyperparasitica TaxID=470096 RepID=A0A6A6WI78_9PEZI|nr:uncharacterized protein EJ05DRAFT_243986 [Pseudovirgaria hyperparasitica]KAF2760851.1 hypothetical protein EJ05DRAFT_243986 [Pseudovirgaria hyperparasitica]